MKLKPLQLATSLALVAAAGVSQAASFPIVDARVAGMGGASVATANLDSAAFYNPALLAAQDSDSDFALSLNAGVGITDANNMTGAISDFSDSLNAFSNLDPALVGSDPTLVQNAFNNLSNSVSNFAGKAYNVNTPANFNLGFAFGKWAASLNARSYIDASVSVGAADGTPNITDGTNTITWTDIQSNPALLASVTTDARLEFNGIQGTEIGLSLARKLELAGLDLAVGITPKLVSIASASGTSPLDSSSSTPSLSTGNATSDVNVDAGVVWNMSEQIRIAGTIRNLIGKSYDTGAGTYELKPQVRAGIGYSTQLFSIGADMDITENDNFGEKSRILAIGSEFNAWDVVQMRVGYRKDLASSLSQYSLGAGLFNSALNLALMLNPENTSQGFSFYAGFGVNF